MEEEIGRIFCSEACIASFFTPEIERLEKDYFKRLSPGDLNGDEREALAHLRWITLQEPDEVWREKTLSGDYRYTLISEFQPGAKKVWSICICLFLRGEPSFLYLAFTTKNASMTGLYRKGERVEWVKPDPQNEERERDESAGDRLADSWTEDETFMAQVNQERKDNDIPAGEFAEYQDCLEESLENPDEVWSMQAGGEDSVRMFHFIHHYSEEKPSFYYVIIARETEDEEQIEILDAFPTRDAALVDRYRRGEQEVGQQLDATSSASRVIH